MRIVIPEGTSTRLGPRYCEHKGCVSHTRESKPFCTDHNDLNPHARRVIEELQRREVDDERAQKGRRGINVDGVTAVEILQNVAEHGPRTKERLCRELNLDVPVLDGYVEALRRAGKIRLTLSRRGSEVVTLAG
jgi:predicted transcriptional regulator